MGAQELIKNFIERYKNRKLQEKELENQDRLIERIQQKKMSHEERILNKLLEENRQKRIKQRLNFELAKRRNEERKKARELLFCPNKLVNNNRIMKNKNIFKNQKSILKS